MGKATLLLMTAALIGGSITLFQSNRTSIETTGRQVDRQEVMLAREVARSGHNYVTSLALELEAEGKSKNKGNGKKKNFSVAELVAEINGSNGFLTGSFKGGTYKAWLEVVSHATYVVNAEGRFGDASHFIGRRLLNADPEVPLEVPKGYDKFTLKARFIDSQAGYCSAIYLQRVVSDDGNNGHGNDEDGKDPSNPAEIARNGGGVSALEQVLEPELIFASGKNRNGSDALYEGDLAPGTLMNFILAVDTGCRLQDTAEGQTAKITNSKYDYTHSALVVEAGKLSEMVEGKYAILEKSRDREGVWRIAFEDLIRFSDEQHADVKKNGYGNKKWDGVKGTYGGNGWTERDETGYYELENTSILPDFSDQVFEIELVPVKENKGKKDKDDKDNKKDNKKNNGKKD